MSKYDSYKDSGVEWMGEIPHHWEISKLKYKVTCNDEVLSEAIDSNTIINYIEIGDVQFTKGITNSTCLLFKDAPSRARRIVRVNDVLVSTVRTYLKAIAQVDERFDGHIASTGFAILRSKRVNATFLGHAMQTEGMINEIVANSTGVSYPAISSSILMELPIALPPLPEQIAIANYLDQKTAIIDQLIQRTSEKITKLQELRTATINQAVTKGLDPTVPMKDSGVEWIGEIPEGWILSNIRYYLTVLTDFTANGSFASLAANVDYLESGYSRLIRLTDLRENLFNRGIYVSKKAHDYLSKSSLKTGDILMANVGAYSGLVCRVPEIDFPATLGPNMFLLKFGSYISQDFIFYLLNSSPWQKHLEVTALSSAQPKLNKEDIRQLRVLIPPLPEQSDIANYLDQKTSEIDALIQKEANRIELLNEYRQSLISEVVTGKFCVLDEIPVS